MLDDGVMRELGEDFYAGIFRDVCGDQDKVQFAFAAQQSFASGEQNARTQDKWEQAFHRFGRGGFFHNQSIGARSPCFSFIVPPVSAPSRFKSEFASIRLICESKTTLLPSARCNPGNIASRKTLQTPGFVPSAHILTGS